MNKLPSKKRFEILFDFINIGIQRSLEHSTESEAQQTQDFKMEYASHGTQKIFLNVLFSFYSFEICLMLST